MQSICSQSDNCGLMQFFCFVYDFQTLLIGALAILVAIVAGIPVWRQLRDSNLQARISHRETLASLLRDALQRYKKVDQSINEPLSLASRLTRDPIGEPTEIDAEDAHHLENSFNGMLDWYLVTLANTEHSDVESAKARLKTSIDELIATLSDAHWADHNEQHDEDHDISDEKWEEIVARCAEAKTEAATRVSEVESAYSQLRNSQQAWTRSLRSQIAALDAQIATPQT